MQQITPFIWFDTQAQEAVKLYTSVFPKSKILTTTRYSKAGAAASGQQAGSVMTVGFRLLGQEFAAINGGSYFTLNPSVSLFVQCKTEQELDTLFSKLSPGGEIMMPLDKYPFAPKYAFFKDKYGLSWQLMLTKTRKPIAPCLLFVGKNFGKAKAAVTFYTTVFPRSKINHMELYKKGEPGTPGTVKHASFMLAGQEFTAMDGPGTHKFGFNESVSFVVNCKDQKEIDMYWKKLSAGGAESQCGWLKDKFGVSWQVNPAEIGKMLANKDPAKGERVMQAVLQMTKIDIATLKTAYSETV